MLLDYLNSYMKLKTVKNNWSFSIRKYQLNFYGIINIVIINLLKFKITLFLENLYCNEIKFISFKNQDYNPNMSSVSALETGVITQVIGPVVDIEFPAGNVPNIYNAVVIETGDTTITGEVQQLLGGNKRVRAVAMSSTEVLPWCCCTRHR